MRRFASLILFALPSLACYTEAGMDASMRVLMVGVPAVVFIVLVALFAQGKLPK